MDNISRIHLAKTPYNISLSAKTQLEKYLTSLEHHLADAEVLADIEQRITEILADHHIQADGVIDDQEVTIIINQLGQPEDFSDEDATPLTTTHAKRLYRHPSQGLLGGVSAGLATYFTIDVMWIRLAWIILGLASFGSVSLLYILLWIITPAVKTPSDLLSLQGKAITAQAIQQAAEQSGDLSRNNDQRIIRLMTLLLGGGLALGALLAISLTIAGGIIIYNYDFGPSLNNLVLADTLLPSWVISPLPFVISGLLLAALLGIWSITAFQAKVTKATAILSAVIIFFGLLSFGAGLWGARFIAQQTQQFITNHTRTTTLAAPVEANNLTHLILNTQDLEVIYKVTTGPFKATYTSLDTAQNPYRQPQIKLDQQTLTVDWQNVDQALHRCHYAYTCQAASLTIEGPALTKLTASKGDNRVSYIPTRQDSLVIADQDNQGAIWIEEGYITNLIADSAYGSTLNARNSSLNNVQLSLTGSARVDLATIKTLNLTTPKSCPDNASVMVVVNSTEDGQFQHNGLTTKLDRIVNDCFVFDTTAGYNEFGRRSTDPQFVQDTPFFIQ